MHDFPAYPLNLLALANAFAGIYYLHHGYGALQFDAPSLGSDDMLLGGSRSDFLLGSTGDDILKGGRGADLLADTSGRNKMVGGGGDDVFLFVLDDSASHAAFARIKDFAPGEDVIALVTGLPDLAPGPLGETYFHQGKAAVTADHHVIYDGKSGKVFFDVDGAGGEAQFKFVKVTPGTKLHADDFMIMPSSLGAS